MAGMLYIVATPIGNLEDITLRALRVLKEVNCIAAEDTRHTKKLLNHFDIPTPLVSYHEHNEISAAPALVERLCRGESIALVSDAGTPGISDPGYRLIVAAAAAGLQVIPVPGPAALIAALSVSGLPTDRFVFEGFLPEKRAQRKERLLTLRDEPRTLVFYEAPHRLKEALADIESIFGERAIVMARELSKIHEQVLRGSISELNRRIAADEIRGEVVLVVHGSPQKPAPSEELIREAIMQLHARGMRVKEIAQLLSEKYGLPKRQIYRAALALQKDSTG
jgi:16S rRNA (cytidine1402-2'-O)-methyltransferase